MIALPRQLRLLTIETDKSIVSAKRHHVVYFFALSFFNKFTGKEERELYRLFCPITSYVLKRMLTNRQVYPWMGPNFRHPAADW